MNPTLRNILIAGAVLVTGGNIPVDKEAMEWQYSYQYEAGSDRTIYRIVDGEIVAQGISPDADFEDTDANGIITVSVFTDRKGNDVYVQTDEAKYEQMKVKGGYQFNPQKEEYITVFEAIATPVEAAIAVDATSEGYANATSLTFAHTVTGANTAITVALFTFGGGDSVSGITYNGEALTEFGTQASDASGYTQLWGKSGADTGTNNIVISMTSSQMFATAASYTGADQTTPFPDTAVTGSSNSTSFSPTITTTVADSWIVLAGRSPSKAPTAGANTIVRKLNGSSADAGWTLDSNGARSTGSNALNWSYSGSSNSYWVMTALAPASEAPGEATTTPRMRLQGDIQIGGDIIIQ